MQASPLHSLLEALVSLLDAADAALRQGGIAMLVVMGVLYSWLRGRRR